MSSADETIADRIENVRRAIPPKQGVRARVPYASVDYFAELLGTNRQRINDWINKGTEPQPRYRQKLAELSKGRYTPDDFAEAQGGGGISRRLAELEVQMASVLERQDLGGETVVEIVQSISLLRDQQNDNARLLQLLTERVIRLEDQDSTGGGQ